jgi:hypothetical protein
MQHRSEIVTGKQNLVNNPSAFMKTKPQKDTPRHAPHRLSALPENPATNTKPPKETRIIDNKRKKTRKR